MVFLVTKKLEEYLDKETRNITMPDGSIRSFTYFQLTWKEYDRLINYTDSYTAEKLINLIVRSSKETGHSIENSFYEVIGYIHKKFRDICNANIDKRIAEIDKRLNKFGMANKSVSARKERINYIEKRLKCLEIKARTDFNKIA